MAIDGSVSTDGELVRQALQGEVAAFGKLVERYQDRVFNFVFHLLGHVQDTEEVVQEAFVRAFQSLRSFRGDSEFYTWLCAIASRLAIRCAKKRAKGGRVTHFSGTGGLNDQSGPGDPADPADQVLRDELVCEIRRAILGLPEKFRIIIVLVDIDGLSYQEVAGILKIPVNTVRSRLARARERLRQKLRGLLQNGAK